MPLTWHSTTSPTNLWQKLQSLIDLVHWKPTQAEGIVARELRDRAGAYFILKNPRARTYLRLSPREHWLWERLDGTQSVQDLVLAYFLAHGTFAFGLVVGLVQQLYTKQMLREQPRFIFTNITRAIQERRAMNRAAAPARALLSRQWTIRGLDRIITRLYRASGWLIFSRAAQFFYFAVCVVGAILYLRILSDESFRFLISGNVGINIAVLWALTTLPVIVHELGHALTTKHYGIMLYLGLPAAFVDTSDIWLEPKRARLAVTWAGPYSGFILAGICAILIWFYSDALLAPILFQLASIALVLSLLNLNPALALDGYHMLSDAVEIPRLQERS